MTNEPDDSAIPGPPASTMPPAAGAAVPFKDRRTGLILFGVLLIACGALFLAGAAAMLGAAVVVADAQAPGADTHAILASIPMYVALAAGLVWLGVGSIQCRRWAPPLMLTLGWVSLITVVLSFAATPFVVQGLSETVWQAQGQPEPADFRTFMAGCLLAMGVAAALPPLAAVLFFRSPHVLATCAARDPRPRWTDRCPTAVVALVITSALTAISILPGLLGPRAVVPAFGTLVTGTPARLAQAAFAGALVFSAWSLARMERRGWLVAFVASAVAAGAFIVTFWIVSPAEFIALLLPASGATGADAGGIPPEALGAAVGQGAFAWIVAISWLSWLAFVWYTKRHFPPAAPAAAVGGPGGSGEETRT